MMLSLTIRQVQDLAHMTAIEKGFWLVKSPHNVDQWLAQVAMKLALVHSEVSEALEELRDVNNVDNTKFGEELADVIIRVGDLASAMEIDLGAAIASKLEKNKLRPNKHGKRF